MIISEAVQSSRREGLEALRDLLAERLVEADVARTAPIAKQLADVLRELDGMAVPSASTVDDLAARRAERRSARASGS